MKKRGKKPWSTTLIEKFLQDEFFALFQSRFLLSRRFFSEKGDEDSAARDYNDVDLHET